MTIINRSYSFIFVHVPKTAGTSLTNMLSKYTSILDLEIGGTEWGEQIQRPYRERFGVGKHATSGEIKKAIGEGVWNNSFKFGFSRHPLLRCYSTYNFLRKWQSPNKSFNKEMRKFKKFEDFVTSNMLEKTNGPDRIFCPQATWLVCDDVGEDLCVDYVGKVETIEEDIKYVYKKIFCMKENVSEVKVPVINESKKVPKNKKWPDEVVHRVKEIYQIDYRLFGYD